MFHSHNFYIRYQFNHAEISGALRLQLERLIQYLELALIHLVIIHFSIEIKLQRHIVLQSIQIVPIIII